MTYNVTIQGIFQVDVHLENYSDDAIVEATVQTLVSLNETLASHHTDICPIFFTQNLERSELYVADEEGNEVV